VGNNTTGRNTAQRRLMLLKFVKLKNAYALAVEKYEKLSKELDIFNNSISCLRTKNTSLNAKIE
jgi:hypothetical protein